MMDVLLMMEGTEGMSLEFSSCCHPIPGDSIVGILQTGKGIAVHVDDCLHAAKLMQHAQSLPLRWADSVQGQFLVPVEVVVENSVGVLVSLAQSISDAGSNVEDIRMQERDGLHCKVMLQLLVRDRVHLAQILKNLRQLKSVIKITRL